MDKVKINKKLYEIVLLEEGYSLRKEIAIGATETEDPAGHLTEMYRNQNMRYSFDADESFIVHAEDIVRTIQNHDKEIHLELTVSNYTTELSYLAYQITLQNMLIEFGMITREQAFF